MLHFAWHMFGFWFDTGVARFETGSYTRHSNKVDALPDPAASRLRFRQLLVVFQVSIAVMLVIGAGLLIKSFWLLQRVDPGFQAEGVLSAGLTLPRIEVFGTGNR